MAKRESGQEKRDFPPRMYNRTHIISIHNNPIQRNVVFEHQVMFQNRKCLNNLVFKHTVLKHASSKIGTLTHKIDNLGGI